MSDMNIYIKWINAKMSDFFFLNQQSKEMNLDNIKTDGV